MRDKYKRDEDCYHRAKTHNEMVHNQDEEFVRAKRRPKALANIRDRNVITFSKTKKDYTKQKHRPGGRGKKHSIELGPEWKTIWELEKYCKAHDIPYRVEEKKRSYTRKRWFRTKRVPWYETPVYRTVYKDGVRTQIRTGRYTTVYREVDCEPYYTTYRCRELLGYTFIWWSDKDIGIQYILKGKN